MSGEDERSEAVRRAEAGQAAWRQALIAQRTARPDHADFYALAGEMSDTLAVLEQLARVLGRQVAGYASGQAPYDDAGADPVARLAEAVAHLGVLADRLGGARCPAQRWWSAIGHIGVAVDR